MEFAGTMYTLYPFLDRVHRSNAEFLIGRKKGKKNAHGHGAPRTMCGHDKRPRPMDIELVVQTTQYVFIQSDAVFNILGPLLPLYFATPTYTYQQKIKKRKITFFRSKIQFFFYKDFLISQTTTIVRSVERISNSVHYTIYIKILRFFMAYV